MVCAIVVTYNSDLGVLRKLLGVLSTQADIIICDNSIDDPKKAIISQLAEQFRATYCTMPDNVGIGAAQNHGIALAHQRAYEFVFFLDDDSIPDQSLVRNLIEVYRQLTASGVKVGAVGARARDSRGNDISNAAEGNAIARSCSQMMSSGALIPTEALRDVGVMNELLFIDCVDFDWGWRAIDRGYRLFLAAGCYFQHSLGEGHLPFGPVRLGIPSPVRHYYQYRNILLMLSKPYVPKAWKAKQLMALMVKLAVFPCLVPPRIQRLRYMLRGIADWRRNCWGKCSMEFF